MPRSDHHFLPDFRWYLNYHLDQRELLFKVACHRWLWRRWLFETCKH
jgi:hypothetical protein